MNAPRADGGSIRAALAAVARVARAADAKEPRAWLALADALPERWPLPWVGPPYTKTFFVRSFTITASGALDAAGWCVAPELVDAASSEQAEAEGRLVSLADVSTTRCPSCGNAALVVGRDHEWQDSAADIRYETELFALCLDAPHVSRLAVSEASHYPASC